MVSRSTTTSFGRADNVSTQTLVELQQNDYIEIFIENNTDTTNLTVTDMSVLITNH